MKYNTAILSALAAGATSVHAAPSRSIQARDVDAGVACMRKSFPNWPAGGDPSKEQEQLKTCYPRPQNNAARGLEPSGANITPDADMEPRDLLEDVKVLGGKVLGINQKPDCKDAEGEPTTRHKEFIFTDKVELAGAALCDNAMNFIDKTGIADDGGIGYASQQMTDAFLWQDDWLKKGRKLLLTMTISYFPPAKMTKDGIQEVATGLRKLCSSSIVKMMKPEGGCKEEISWFVTGKGGREKGLAAKGGRIGMWLDSTNQQIGTVQLGFSED